MNHICTWLCADEKGEESHFPQTGQSSSSQSHQNIYWRCVLTFFITSKRFNKKESHVLFTNVKHLPSVDGIPVSRVLNDLQVEVIHTDFKYKTPKGYFGKFQNQFYEFSILEYISEHNKHNEDLYLVMDSDCIFIKPAERLFTQAAPNGFLSFTDPVAPDYVINGLSRNDLKSVYQDLLEKKIYDIPEYHLGEFLLCSVSNIRKIFSDFLKLWPTLLVRNAAGHIKFNEEAHTLSYLYYINNFQPSKDINLMRRIWTNPLFYRDVRPSDTNLVVWHLPAEKTFGLHKLYTYLLFDSNNYGLDLSPARYLDMVQKIMGIPYLPTQHKLGYYILSYYRAIRKRILKLNPLKRRPVVAPAAA